MVVEDICILKVSEMLGLRKTKRGYRGVFCTGQFDNLHDYNVGLLELSIHFLEQQKGIFVYFSLSTIDDGIWSAWDSKPYKTVEEALVRIEEIKTRFELEMQNSKSLPNESILNEWLIPLGLYGTYQG